MTDIDGFARCTREGCQDFDVDRPIALVQTSKVQYGEDAYKRTPLVETFYLHAADDRELKCPSCGTDCAIIDAPRRAVPELAPR